MTEAQDSYVITSDETIAVAESFCVVDVETANQSPASICQIGVASYHQGVLVEGWMSYVDPEDYFARANIEVHGITPRRVMGEPTWAGIVIELRRRLHEAVVFSHTNFDRRAMEQAFRRYELQPPRSRWLDSTTVVRRAWPERFAKRGYNLPNVAQFLGLQYRAHDALEDARITGEVVLAAMRHSGKTLAEWAELAGQGGVVKKNSAPAWAGKTVRRTGVATGRMRGESVVFTGELSISREKAAQLAAEAGCNVEPYVTRRTTIMVVGRQDIRQMGGRSLTSKQMHAATRVAEGQPIRMLDEASFVEMLKAAGAL